VDAQYDIAERDDGNTISRLAHGAQTLRAGDEHATAMTELHCATGANAAWRRLNAPHHECPHDINS
jgi:hypothetical protein